MPSHYPLTVQFNRHSEADVPIFEQITSPEFDSLSRLITQVGNIAVKNSAKLADLKSGGTHAHVYPQDDNSPSAKSDSDIWRHLENQFWGSDYNKYGKLTKGSSNSFNKRIGNNQNQINSGLQDREGMRNRIKALEDQKDKLWKRTDFSKHDHTHSGGGTEEDCGWFGEKCWFKDFKLFGDINPMLILGAVGVGAFLLLKKK